MHILILSDHIQRAQFIKNGLRFENLHCEIVMYQGKIDSNSIMAADGLFTLLQNPIVTATVVNEVLGIKPVLPVIILSQNYHQSYFELLHQHKKIRNYFTRPFPFRLMASEMRANIFQNKEEITEKTVKHKNLEINRETHEVWLNGDLLHLSPKEYAFLEFLMINREKVLTRQIILEQVWDRNANIFTNTVDVHVNKLRKKLGMGNNYIKTVPRIGYVFS